MKPSATKMFALFVLILTVITATFAQTNVSGTLTSDTQWKLTGSPYMVTANVTVADGITLTVDSGVVVLFQNDQGLYVRGTLRARMALFTSSKDTLGGNPAKGDWNKIQVGEWGDSGTVVLDTCQVRYGGRAWGPSDEANVYAYWGTATLTGCDISSGKNYGIMIYSAGNVTCTNSNVVSCEWPFAYVGQGSLVFNGINNFSGNVHNGINVRIGSNDNAMVLDTVGIPYVFGDYTVISGGSLTIAPTNVIKFYDWCHLYVEGGLTAVAGEGEKIYFTSYTDDNLFGDTNADGTATNPNSSQWGGIYFRENSVDGLCTLRRSVVTFAGAGNIGGITMVNASPTIDYCEMANNYYGAMLQDVSNPVFSNNIIGSSQMVPIAMSFTANPLFSDNSLSFSDNQYDAIGLLGSQTPSNGFLPIRSVTSIPNISYLLLQTVVVPVGHTLTIQKGVVIKGYLSDHRIVIQGKLIANGSADSTIVFTSVKDDMYGNPFDTNRDGTATSPQRGDWGAITFEATSDTNSVMNYCILKYGSQPWTYYNTRWIYGGQITTVNASPTISNCEIKDVVYGVYAFQSSKPKISNTTFINTQYTPVALSVSAVPTMTGLTFTNTSWTALGIIGEEVGFNGSIIQRNVAGYTNITYILLDDLTINSGTYVSVSPGVVIKSSGPGIFVNGGFRARGTRTGNIIFTSIKDDNYGNPYDSNNDGAGTSPSQGDWSTIRFQATSDDSYCILDSCIVKFGGNEYNGTPWGNVTFTDASGSVTHTLLSDSHNFGVRCEGSATPLIDRVEMKNCRRDPIAISLTSNPVLTNIIFTSNGTKGIYILEGTLSSSAKLYKRDVAGINNIAYIVDRLTVSSNAILTIEPGVVIKFPYASSYWCGAINEIIVQGAMIAEGTATQKIVFTSIKDDANGGDTNNDGNSTTPERGDWFSLRFESSATDALNSLKNCQIRYGGSGTCQDGDPEYKTYGAVRFFDASGTVDSCSIEHSNTTGIGIYGSADPVIRNSQINNVSSTPISLSLFSNPTFQNNSALNVGYMALGVVTETYSVNATVPKRDFAGYTNITYMLYPRWSSTYTINSGTVITIPAGVVFKGEQGFVVNGGLIINGTPSSPVVFTDPKDDTYGNPGDMNGDGYATKPSIYGNDYPKLTFNDVSDDSSCIVRNAVIRYVQHAISLEQASPTITNCLFSNDDWGVRLNGVSTPAVDSCTFTNLTDAPLQTSLVSYPRSTLNNTITGTTYRAIGILEETLVQDITLVKRTFAGITNIPYLFSNYTVGTGAILTLQPGVILKFFPACSLTVKKGLIAQGGASPESTTVFADLKNDFYGGDTNADSNATAVNENVNTWLGIVFTDESLDPNCQLKYCVVRDALCYYNWYGCVEGTGIKTYSASPTIEYCTITNNRYGIVTNGASNPVIHYSDIFKNTYYGVKNADRSFNFDARYNWWGNNSGPTHSGNPGGTGDIVTDSVNYTPFRTSGAQQPVAGDVSLNGLVQAYDASMILKYVVDSTSNPLSALQKHAADVSGQAGITAYDASLILQYVVGNIIHFPSEGGFAKSLIVAPTVAASAIEIGSANVSGATSVTIPLLVHSIGSFASADLQLSFDASIVTPAEIKLVSEYSGLLMSTSVIGNRINIGIASTRYMTVDGALLEITFNVTPLERGTSKATVSCSRLLINEQDYSSAVTPGEIVLTGKPLVYALAQNYPNPFNPTTTIQYELPEDGVQTNLTVYNTLGEVVRVLVNGIQDAGQYTIQWDGHDASGHVVSTGVYYLRMTAHGNKDYSTVKKMIFMK